MKRKGPQKEMSLGDLLEASAKQMADSLRNKLLLHPGELGTAREEIGKGVKP